MRAPCVINGESVAAGSRGVVRLPLPGFYTHAPSTMPVQIIHGRQSGPSLLVTSALHGDEINGVEIIRRLSGRAVLNRMKGTLILVPVMNVFGFLAQSRYLPDRRDLNRSFPGSPKGSMASRLANLVTTEILPACTHVIDLHTGAVARENLPQIRAAFSDNPELETLAKAFNAPLCSMHPSGTGRFAKPLNSTAFPRWCMRRAKRSASTSCPFAPVCRAFSM